MARFKRKPTEIEAWQYRAGGPPDCEGVCRCNCAAGAHVHTAHAGQTVLLEDRDWITPELLSPGKYYPIKPEVFEATYEPVHKIGY